MTVRFRCTSHFPYQQSADGAREQREERGGDDQGANDDGSDDSDRKADAQGELHLSSAKPVGDRAPVDSPGVRISVIDAQRRLVALSGHFTGEVNSVVLATSRQFNISFIALYSQTGKIKI